MGAREIERQAAIQREMAYLQAAVERKNQSLRAMVEVSLYSIKFIYTANGAAALAILAFLGQLVVAEKQGVFSLGLPIGFYLGGVTFAFLASCFAYFVNKTFYERDGAVWSFRLAMASVLLGGACFVVGSFLAVRAIA